MDDLENEMISKLCVQKYKNTSIYENETLFILSPFIGSESHWFDIRLVNIIKYPKNKKGYIILRDIKYGFHICDLDNFLTTMTPKETCINTKKSGKHWKYFLESGSSNLFYVINQHGKQVYNCDFDNIECL